MNVSKSILYWMATLFVGACAAPSVGAPSEIESDAEGLQAAYCTSDRQCPISHVACRPCSDGSYTCPEVDCVKGRCLQSFPACPTYNPCADHACGDTCRVCDPKDPKCLETALVEYCHLDGSCSASAPICDKCATVKCSATTHCVNGACIANDPKVTCGGIAGIKCPEGGLCVDDPSDSCDPQHGGADCGGVCVCDKLARCALGYHFDRSLTVCACVPDAPKVFCGGFAGIPCPGAGQCVDDPSDSCDPKHGGADCGGLCECSALAKCAAGSHFDSSPSVCACVPGVTCGSKTCDTDQVCCSPSCGICGPKNGACPAIACAVTL
jgi:hypothetical protein